MRFGDALDDGQAQTDARVVMTDVVGAALEGLGEGRDQLCWEDLAGVLDGERHASGMDAGRYSHDAPTRQVVDDRVMDEIDRHLQQERAGADGRGDVARGLDGDAVLLR